MPRLLLSLSLSPHHLLDPNPNSFSPSTELPSDLFPSSLHVETQRGQEDVASVKVSAFQAKARVPEETSSHLVGTVQNEACLEIKVETGAEEFQMDRHSWLWRRKSSEKSPAETESSGSVSSHSERFSDEQAQSMPGGLSLEVMSKASTVDGDINDSTRTLSDKLSTALLNIRAKEALVKQQAKVAEEAVSGWENAENEVSILKKQLEAAVDRNSKLDDRIGHLDSALKECVRQLRLARDEQEQKIHEAVSKRDREWEPVKVDLESKLAKLRGQLQAAITEPLSMTNPEYHTKLEAIEKENLSLKSRILSVVEELEIRVLERDLSTQAAESVSKQNLENMKKTVRLESECRRLRAISRKSPLVNDFSCLSASSAYIESFADRRSDVGECLLAVENDVQRLRGSKMTESDPRNFESRNSVISQLDHLDDQKIVASSGEVNLMDDFLEMERLAALPDAENCKLDHVLDRARAPDVPLPSELQVLINRTAELEEELEKKEAEKTELEMVLIQCQKQLKASHHQLEEAKVKLIEYKSLLSKADQYKEVAHVDKKAAYVRAEIAESRMETLQTQLKQNEARSIELENLLSVAEELRQTADENAKAAFVNVGLAESKMKALNDQLIQNESRLLELNNLLSEAEESKRMVAEKTKSSDAELKMIVSKLQNASDEIERLLVKIKLLEEEAEKENALSAETTNRCKALEEEIMKLKEADLRSEAKLQPAPGSKTGHKIKQEEELALAADRFAECQKTIASLHEKLTCLGLVDDFMFDPEENPESMDEGLQAQEAGGEPFQMHSREIFPFKTYVTV